MTRALSRAMERYRLMQLGTQGRQSAALAWLPPVVAAVIIGIGASQLPFSGTVTALLAAVLTAGVAIYVHRARERQLAGEQRHFAQRQRAQQQLIHAQNMEAIGNFAGGIAHDFNNLFGTIIGNLDLLREAPGRDPEIDELAGDALAAAIKGAELTRGLLAFARRQPLQPRRTDVNKLIGDIAAALGRSLGERIRITLDLAPSLWPVLVDPAQLEVALVTLTSFARDMMAKDGKLRLGTANLELGEDYAANHPGASPGAHVVIEVSDSGMGLAPELLARVFEPFSAIGARGLGLSTVFGFAMQSGGHIGAESKPGQGTTFRLYLPRAGDHAERDEPAPRGNGEIVLAVDDDDAWRQLATRQLAELGYEVREAENAAAAIAVIEAEPQIALVFSDVAMPGRMDGRGLARQVRGRWPRIKVVLASGLARAKVFDGSVPAETPFLAKPYRKEDLARTLREVLDAPPARMAEPVGPKQKRGAGHGAHSGNR
jgi:signal transduction histidine kinase/ActR/RegA family two-component response regulator